MDEEHWAGGEAGAAEAAGGSHESDIADPAIHIHLFYLAR
jgi:hypothetical protein